MKKDPHITLIGKLSATIITTNNPKQLKTTFVGVVLLSVRKPNHTTPHHVITFKAVQGNQGGWFLVCNLILTRLEENGRQPEYFW